MGFDRFYGFVGSDATQWGPNTTYIYPRIGHEGGLKMDPSDPKAATMSFASKRAYP